MSARPDCSYCLGSGWDDAFSAPCSCVEDAEFVHANTDHARAEYERRAANKLSEADQDVDLAVWLAQQTWSDFAQSLAKSFTRNASFTTKQRAAAQSMRAKVEARDAEKANQPATFRWTKAGEAWVIRGPKGHDGQTVTVTKRSGETSEVNLGAEIGMDDRTDDRIYEVAKNKPATRPGRGPVERPDGFYFVEGEPVRIFKLQHAVHGSGNQYAKELDGESWEYAGRAPLKLDLQPLTLEQAKQYGHLYGRCMLCGRTLTDENSIEQGIGPVCANKL